jgi:hypothetical protein
VTVGVLPPVAPIELRFFTQLHPFESNLRPLSPIRNGHLRSREFTNIRYWNDLRAFLIAGPGADRLLGAKDEIAAALCLIGAGWRRRWLRRPAMTRCLVTAAPLKSPGLVVVLITSARCRFRA